MPLASTDRVSFRSRLILLGLENVLFNEVMLSNGNSIFGVRIFEVSGDFVTFQEEGSAGSDLIAVPFDDIVALDYA
ncbi:hypothetical protein GCM10011391_20580 [Pullulanibacillus camelliae]|uniref:Uncharacterized protein n=1 Tax=Pullulanibacillus camelliae TaxID=1707096 RepID=A0A8J2VXE7_9BACL|nr:hypothetical protein [Pullulanibacillus camelliae]GGE41710.1 hypothetical protein GCM10011391_20580 [Pullulanibacillus camelliae]